MAEIIDIRKRLRQTAPGGSGAGPLLRIRICGPDLHWVGVVGGVLAGALAGEGWPASFAEPEPVSISSPAIDLVAGEPGSAPGLIIIGGKEITGSVLHGCDNRTVLLVRHEAMEAPQNKFAGRLVPLRSSDPAPEPLLLAAACAGGAARLLGTIGWSNLEQSLRREIAVAEPLESYLIIAFEAYHRLAPWAGVVPGQR